MIKTIGPILSLMLVPALYGDSLTREYPAKVQRKGEIQAWAFPLQDVVLTESLFTEARDRNAGWLLSLEPDRLLAWFRKEAGLEPRGAVYGGWESMGIAGHSLGHYLSACSMMAASTGDSRFKERVDAIVSELALCQAQDPSGYVAAIPEGKRVFREVADNQIRSAGFDLNGVWVPWYTMHKVLAGLRDAYVLTGSTKALDVLEKLADWAVETTKNLTDENWQKMLACEHGGMNEVCADVYALTGNEKYLTLARKFYHKQVLDPLSRRENVLPGIHANTQIPKVIGTSFLYELTGEERYRTISRFFWETVVNHHSFANGGNSANEYFGQPDKLSVPMHDTTETCNTCNMLKLTRRLFAENPQAGYMDYYECALYNHILAHQHPTTGMIMYKGFVDMPAKKNFSDPYDSFWCCVGTGFENHAKYQESIYFHNDAVLYVNLFIPSRLNWKAKGLTVTQETGFPLSDVVALSFDAKKPAAFTLKIRRPHWVREMTLRVNGKSQPVKADESGYIAISRTFKSGDRVELQMPMSLRTEGLPDKPERLAFLYGPILLAADLDGDTPLPVLVGSPESLIEAFKFAGSLKFHAAGIAHLQTDEGWKESDLDFLPLYAVADQRYTVYMDAFTPEQWLRNLAAYEAEQQRLKEQEARTVDVLRIGEMQPERDHQLTGENTETGEFAGRKWRHALNGGRFEFRMKTLPDVPMELLCTYWGSDAGGREFDILIDGTKIADQRLENNRPGEFFNVAYPIPADLTKGKETVTVRLQAKPGRICGGLFGPCRMLKATPPSSTSPESFPADPVRRETRP
jgi:DUF1680 family protein